MAFSSVIIFIIDIRYLAVPDLECQAPVARDVQAPHSLAVPGKLVGFPQWESTQFFRVLHVLQEGQHCAELVHGIRRQAFSAVLQVEPFQALMDEIPYFHWSYCSPLPYTCQLHVSTTGGSAIASDHAPNPESEKVQEFERWRVR